MSAANEFARYCEWFCESKGKIVLAAELPCEWTFATNFASDCECDGLVHSIQGVLQGAAKRGAQLYFILAVLRALLSCGQMGLFYVQTCTPMKATPEAPLDFKEKLRGSN